MPTPFTWNYRVQCKKGNSLTDDELYYVDIPTSLPKSVASDLANELRSKGFKEVRILLIENIP